MPEISVVIPLYNQQRLIGKTLSDLLVQDFKDFEIIVVDDASTDESARIAQRVLSDSRVPWTLLGLPVNSGASEARNKGLEAASGKSVFFLDGDDRVEPETLGRLAKAMQETGAPLSFCGFTVSPEKGGEGRTYVFPLPPGAASVDSRRLLVTFLRGKRYLNASNVLYDISFLRSTGIRFPRGCRFAEDREFIAKALFHAGKAAVIPDPLVRYIQHGNQSTSRMAKDPSKYAHEAGVYLRLRKYLAERQAEWFLLSSIDSLEIPGSVIRMATSAVLSGREDLFWRIVRSRKLRYLARKGLGAWKTKPEIAFKALLFAFAPGLLLGLYRRKAKHR